MTTAHIAWLIPCYNEAQTIEKVIGDIVRHAPGTAIYVFDNHSTDQTAERARAAGATVFPVVNRGKGHVVRRMFELVNADIYLMIDGDDTYEVADWRKLVDPILNRTAEMTVGVRTHPSSSQSFRRFHGFGNTLITSIFNFAFQKNMQDILSGYRAFSHQFVKGIAIDSKGFEIEVNLTIQALENNLQIEEVETSLRARPEGSVSKLRTFQDGFKILYTIIKLAKDYKPLTFFGLLSLMPLCALALIKDASSLLILISGLLFSTGLILNSISQRAKEITQIIRKSIP